MSETTSTEKGKKTEGNPGKGSSKRPASKSKPAKEPRPRKEKALDTELCVFAMRLPRKDRDRLHAIAGSARASKFVIAATMAALEGDLDAFKKVVASRATK
jgi:hypothetical protein